MFLRRQSFFQSLANSEGSFRFHPRNLKVIQSTISVSLLNLMHFKTNSAKNFALMFCYFREHNVFNGFNKTFKLYCCEPGFINTNFGVCFCKFYFFDFA